MSIYEGIRKDIVTAMKTKDKDLSTCLRTLDAAILKVVKDQNKDLTDALVLDIIKKSIKDLDTTRSFTNENDHKDLRDKLNTEEGFLSKYLPKMLSLEETEAAISKIMAARDTSSLSEMGEIMSQVKKELGASVEMSAAQKIVRDNLTAFGLKEILDYLSSYSDDDLKYLAGYCMGHDVEVSPLPELKYYEHESLMAYLSDWVLMHEESVGIMVKKKITDLPLYINSGNSSYRFISRWRLKVGT